MIVVMKTYIYANQKKLFVFPRIMIGVLGSVLCSAIWGHAQVIDFVGGNNAVWSSSTSWDGAIPGVEQIARINTSSGTPSIVDQDFQLGAIEFNSASAKTITLTAGTFFSLHGVDNALIRNLSNQSLTIAGAGLAQLGELRLAGSGEVHIANANRSISLNNLNITDVGGVGQILKTGLGTLNLNNTGGSNFSAGVRIQEGMVSVNTGSTGSANAPTQGSLGTGTLTLAGGVFRYTGSATGVFHNRVSVEGDVVLGDSAAGRRSFTFTGNVDLNGAQRNLNIGLNDTNAAGRMVQLTGALSNGGLTKSGEGILRLAADNTYEGKTVVQAGILEIAGNGAISHSESIQVDSGATLSIANDYVLAIGQVLHGAGRVEGNLRIGEGIVDAGNGEGALSIAGDVWMDGGVLRFGVGTGGVGSLEIAGSGISVTGNTSGTVHIQLYGSSVDLVAGEYLLISTQGVSSGNWIDWGVDAFTLDTLPDGWEGGLRFENRNLYLDVQPIPEVGTSVVILVVLSGFLVRRRLIRNRC